MYKFLLPALLLCGLIIACDKEEDDDAKSNTYMKGHFGGQSFSFTDLKAGYMGGFLNIDGGFFDHPDSLRLHIDVHTDGLNGNFPIGDTYENNTASMIFDTDEYTGYHSEYTDCTGGVSVTKYATGTLKLHREGQYLTGEYSGKFYLTTSCLINDTKDLSVQFRVKVDQ